MLHFEVGKLAGFKAMCLSIYISQGEPGGNS
jgi:hypothetical protein